MKKKEKSKEEENENTTTLSIHSVTNILGDPKLHNFDSYGVTNFNQTDHNVLMAIAKAFSSTNYKGNLDPVIDNKNPYVQVLPRIQITRASLLKILDIKPTNGAEIQAIFDSLDKLNEQMFHFRYERLCYDENGLPLKTRGGRWKKQVVETKDSLFRVKYLRHEESKQLQAIELVLSSVFVDQRESYFLTIPDSANEELKKLLNAKRIPPAILNFILYIRYQQEMKRRGRRSWKLEIEWEELAKIVRISKLSIRRKKGDVLKNLNKAMDVAKQLGHLKSWKFDEVSFHMILNPPKTEKLLQYEAMKGNKEWAQEIVKDLPSKSGVVVSCSEDYFEIYTVSRAGDPRIVLYSDPQFREKVLDMVEKYKQL